MSINSDKNEDSVSSNMPQIDDENEILSSTSKGSNNEPEKNKILGVFFGIGMNVNNVIGSGIVTSPGIVWQTVKSPGIVLLLWLIGGLISMAGSLSYVELGVIHRISGGETKYLQTAYPNPNLLISYLFSFVHIFAIRPGLLCAVLQSAAQYSWYTIRGYRYDKEITEGTIGWRLPFSPFWVIKLIAVLLLFIITVYHMLSNKWANYINQTLAAIKLVTYSIIAIAGIVKLFSDWSLSRINWQRQLSGETNFTAYSTTILLIMFSYDGWNSLNYSLDEFRKPEKKLIFSNSISVGIVTVMYLLVNVAFISVVPETSIIDSSSDETIAATFFRQLFGESEGIVRVFTGLVVLSVFGTAASTVWGGSRVIVAAAASNFFPVYSYELRTWSSRFNTPVNALFAQFIWCTVIILLVGSSFTISSFTLFSSFSMYSYWIFYFATGIGLLVIRHRNRRKLEKEKEKDLENSEETPNVSKPPKKEKLFEVPLPIAGVFILAGLYILTCSFVVDDSICPKLDPKDCRIQQLSPIFISYGFLFIGILSWHFLYCWWNKKKNAIIRIAADEDDERTDRVFL